MLLAENILGKVKWSTEIFVLSNISAMCTEMTTTYDIMTGLRQLLYMCKAEKTELQLGVSVLIKLLQTKYKRQKRKICFV